ncbi:MAG: DNA primase [Sinobacteraceae bacterium]|nr:DNA primase [Nevskiaceae bacterium]MCP5471121.1 DNA primase [Nevskiaceae bacterium]
MAGRIPQNFIDDLVARSDIVELIGSRVPLKKSGREYKACCPFHNEKSPSFWVSPDKQFYHCFGCGAHGSVLGFLMNHDRLSYPEAVEELAARAGVEIPRKAARPDEPQAPGEPLYTMLARVAAHWAQALQTDRRARDYATTRRGLEPATLERFMIGYAANSWNDVLRRFGVDDPSRRSLAETGLIIEREAGQQRNGERYYDRFRDRLMFPIRDARGRVIAFGGRIIDQGEPKYLNSPETPLFHKGRELYGLYEVRQTRGAALKRLLVVEGYMDVVRLHQAGIGYAVATLGTATTAEHLKRVFRVVSEVVFAFDGDRAGRAAAWRALQNALPEAREGREIRFLLLPEGHDPDTLVGAEGREAFEARLGDALPLSEYLVQELAAQSDLGHADGRARFAEAARPLLAKVPDGVYRELLLGRIAESIRLGPERLRELWAAAPATRGGLRGAAGPGTPAVGPDSAAGERPGSGYGRGADARPSPGGGRAAHSAGRGSLMRQAAVMLVHHPRIATMLPPACLEALTQLDEPGADVLRQLFDDLRERPCSSTGQLLEHWRDRPEAERFGRLAATESLISDEKAALRELENAIDRMAEEARMRRFDALLLQEGKRGLSPEEKAELQRLMASRQTAAGSRPKR